MPDAGAASTPRPFHPATGAWLPQAPPAPPVAPDEARKGPLAVAANILLGLDLAILGLFAVLSLVVAIAQALAGTSPTTGPLDGQAILLNALVTFVLMGVIPVAWLLATRRKSVVGTLAYLRLHTPARSLLKGTGLGLAAIAAIVLLGLLLDRLGWMPTNPVADELAKAMTLRLALVLSLTAAVGEEILFRGVLQRWVGVWGQAALFALAHIGYGTVLQLVIPGLLGLGFGLLVKRGASLWVVIAAHFVFDFVQLASAVLVPG